MTPSVLMAMRQWRSGVREPESVLVDTGVPDRVMFRFEDGEMLVFDARELAVATGAGPRLVPPSRRFEVLPGGAA